MCDDKNSAARVYGIAIDRFFDRWSRSCGKQLCKFVGHRYHQSHTIAFPEIRHHRRASYMNPVVVAVAGRGGVAGRRRTSPRTPRWLTPPVDVRSRVAQWCARGSARAGPICHTPSGGGGGGGRIPTPDVDQSSAARIIRSRSHRCLSRPRLVRMPLTTRRRISRRPRLLRRRRHRRIHLRGPRTS